METLSLLIHSRNIYSKGKFIEGSIGVRDDKIVYLGPRKNFSTIETLDASHLHIIPGPIDSQVHFREPGAEYKEDLQTGSKAALRGGITGVFEMPNTNPPTTTAEALTQKLKLAEKRMWVDYAFYVGGTSENFKEVKNIELRDGCPGIKIFVGSSTGTLLLTNPLHIEHILRTTHRTVAFHSEDEDRLKERKKIAIDSKDPISHPVWRDEIVALTSTKKLVELAKKTNRRIHILHVSSEEEVEYLKDKKNLVTVETTPQFLTLWAPDCYKEHGTLVQMNPPIREKRHYDALWRGIQNGTVDVLGSDHAPHTLIEKTKPYPDSPSGMPGVQTLLPLMLDHVNQGRLSLEKLVELVSVNPILKFQIKNRAFITEGADATLTFIDLKEKRKIEEKWLLSRAGWSPFTGKVITGWPKGVLLHGNLAMFEDEVLDFPNGRPLGF